MALNITRSFAGTVLVTALVSSHMVLAQDTIKSGSLRGAGGHKSSGQVRIIKSGGVTKVIFASNFRLDGAPDPRVAFGNGRYVRGTMFAKLRRIRGAQEYMVPKRLNATKFSQVWLWCKKFNSPIAVATMR